MNYFLMLLIDKPLLFDLFFVYLLNINSLTNYTITIKMVENIVVSNFKKCLLIVHLCLFVTLKQTRVISFVLTYCILPCSKS